MNYLELCREVVREGAIIGGNNKPETVINQTGRMQLVTDWVRRANTEIQAHRHDYTFRIRNIDFEVQPFQDRLNMATQHPDVEAINELTATVRTSTENIALYPISWVDYRGRRPTTEVGLPESFSVDTAGTIHFSPAPNELCLFNAECKLRPQVLREDTDVPYIPEGYQDVILHRALMFFYRYDESWDQYNDSAKLFEEWMDRLISATTTLGTWSHTQSVESLMVQSVE